MTIRGGNPQGSYIILEMKNVFLTAKYHRIHSLHSTTMAGEGLDTKLAVHDWTMKTGTMWVIKFMCQIMKISEKLFYVYWSTVLSLEFYHQIHIHPWYKWKSTPLGIWHICHILSRAQHLLICIITSVKVFSSWFMRSMNAYVWPLLQVVTEKQHFMPWVNCQATSYSSYCIVQIVSLMVYPH